MRIIHLTHNTQGGAETATFRIHSCLLDSLSCTSVLRTIKNDGAFPDVEVGYPSGSNWLSRSIAARRCYSKHKSYKPINQEAHFIAYPDTGLGKELYKSRPDIIHLHAIRDLTLSIEEIGRLQRQFPLIWSAHDHWPFAGAEAHPTDRGWQDSFSGRSDLSSWTWNRKFKNWRYPIPLVCASRWMVSECMSSSLRPIFEPHHIPYPLDSDQFQLRDPRLARHELGLDFDDFIFAFSAAGGLSHPRKGGVDLLAALEILHDRLLVSGCTRLPLLLVIGQEPPSMPVSSYPKIRFLGSIDHSKVSAVYCASDVAVIPSLQEPLGQVALEALSCGCPVLASAVGGLLDNVIPEQTGWLSEPGKPEHLAYTLQVAMETLPEKRRSFGLQGREHVLSTCHPEIISTKFLDIYQSSIQSFKNR